MSWQPYQHGISLPNLICETFLFNRGKHSATVLACTTLFAIALRCPGNRRAPAHHRTRILHVITIAKALNQHIPLIAPQHLVVLASVLLPCNNLLVYDWSSCFLDD